MMMKSFWQWFLFPILAFALMSVIITWPLVLHWQTQIPVGLGGDAWVHQWTFWWVKQALAQGKDIFYTKLLFYPDGVSLTSHNIAWFNIAIWLPLQAVWGNLVAYGMMFLVIFTLNGCGMYWLLLARTRSMAAGLIGGLVYGSWPYLVSQPGHPNMPIIMWLPLAILFMQRTFEQKRVRDALLTALFLALTGIGRWQLLILAGFAFGIYFVYMLATHREYRTRRLFLLCGLIGVVALLLMAPLGWPLIADQLFRNYPEDVFVKEYYQGSDLLGWFIPNVNIWPWSWVVRQLPQPIQFYFDRVDFIGHVTLILAVLGARKLRGRSLVWLLMAAFYAIFALGTDFRFANAIYEQVPMPYRLIENISLISIIRYPHRFNAFLSLPVALLAGYGALALRERWSARVNGTLLVGVLALLVVGEHWLYPYRIAPIDVPQWHRQLAQEPGEFGLLELPMDHRGWDKDYMRYQMVHQKPLAQGHISRPTREAYALLQSTRYLSLLQEENLMGEDIGDVTHELKVLADHNIRYLVLHKQFATPEQMMLWRQWLVYAPVHEDDEVVVYETTPVYGRDYAITQPVTEAIGLIAVDSNLAALGGQMLQAGTIQVFAQWGSRAAPGHAYESCLYLDGPAQEQHCFALGGEWPSQEWGNNEIVRETYNAQISPFLAPGDYALTLGLVDTVTQEAVGDPIALGQLTVLPIERVFDAPDMANPLRATFGDQLALLGYDLSEESGQVQVTVYWRALARMDHSYKIFAHLLDANDQRIAQHDAVPRQWSYPTTQWEANEVVSDVLTLKLEQTDAPRPYRIVLGVYDEQTGERLAAVDANGARLPEDMLELAQVE
ncbi:MAG: hypothetical protein KDE54_19990 [Caldilineaceae bacterium]|nr:hypothetical protein [Caldilineaceae bacterium]